MSFWDNLPVFVPEIKHIPYNEDLVCILSDLLQKLDNFFFTNQTTGGIGSTKMEVGEKIDFFSWGKLHYDKNRKFYLTASAIENLELFIYQKAIDFFRPMHAHNKRFLNVGSATRSGSKSDQ